MNNPLYDAPGNAPGPILQLSTPESCGCNDSNGNSGIINLTFLQLLDTPSTYLNQAGKLVIVNPTASGLVFSNPPPTAPVGLFNQQQFVTTDNSNTYYTADQVEIGQFITSDDELTDALSRGSSSQEEIFNKFKRIAHGGSPTDPQGSSVTGHIPVRADQTNSWSYDTGTNKVLSTFNTGSFIGLCSIDKFASYIHQVTLSSSAADNDIIGVIIAYMEDPDDMVTNYAYGLDPDDFNWSIDVTSPLIPNQHVLTLVRCRNGVSTPLPSYAIIYDNLLPGRTVLVNGTLSGVYNTTALWSNASATVDININKDNDTIVVTTTDFSDAPGGKGALRFPLTLDLSSNPILAKFKGAQSYGYCAESQALASYSNITFSGSSNLIYDLRDGDIYEYTTDGYVVNPSRDFFDEVGIRRELYNPYTDKLLYVEADHTILTLAQPTNITSLLSAADNGLSVADDGVTVELGGDLIKPTAIVLNGNSFEILSNASTDLQLNTNQIYATAGDVSSPIWATLEINTVDPTISALILEANSHGISVGLDGKSSVSDNILYVGVKNVNSGPNTGNMLIYFDYSSGIQIEDNHKTAGAGYADDYSVNGQATFGDLFIPPLGLVKSLIPDVSDFVTLSTSQTIVGFKTFTNNNIFNKNVIINKDSLEIEALTVNNGMSVNGGYLNITQSGGGSGLNMGANTALSITSNTSLISFNSSDNVVYGDWKFHRLDETTKTLDFIYWFGTPHNPISGIKFSPNDSGSITDYNDISFIKASGSSSQYIKGDGTLGTYSGGGGTVTIVSVVTANGVSGTVANATTTPAITLVLGAITPTSTNGVSAATMAFNDATSSIQTQLDSKQTSLGFTPYNATNPSNYIALTALSATSPIFYNNSTGVISSQAASASQAGYLTSSDWSTFSGKQATLVSGTSIKTINSTSLLGSGDIAVQPTGNYLTALTGDVTASGPGSAVVTLATVNTNIGSFGTASSVPTIILNGKGLATAVVNTPIQITESQVTNLAADLLALKNTIKYPIRAAVWGDSRAHVGSGTNNDINNVTVTNGNNGQSIIPGRIGGHLSLFSNGKIIPIADGGIGGETSTQGLARDAATDSATRKALTNMANLGAQIVYIYCGINDLLAIRTTTTGPQITTILSTLLTNRTAMLRRCIGLGLIPIVITDEGNTYGPQAVSAGYTAADIQVQNPQINNANIALQALCTSLGVLCIDTHSLFTDLTVGSTYGNWVTTYATPITEDGLHPNINGAMLITPVITAATLTYFGTSASKQVYIGNPGYPNLFDNPTFAKVTSGLATGVSISTDGGTQTVVSTIGAFNNTPSQDFAVTPATFDPNGVSMLHIIFSIPVTGATPVTQIALTDMLQGCADILVDDGSGGIPAIQSYACRMRLFYNGGASSIFSFSPLYNDGLDVNRNFLSVVAGRVTTNLYQAPDVSANLTAVQFSIFVGSTVTTPFRLRISNPYCAKIPTMDLALALKSTLSASLPVYTDAKGNLVSNTVTGTGVTVQATLPTIAAPVISGHPTIEGVTSTGATGTGNLVFSIAPTFTGTTNIATLGVTTINSNSANLFMGSQSAAVTQSASQFQLGGAPNTYLRFGGGSTSGTTLSASASAANLLVGTSIYTTAASGTNPVITSLGIKPPTITVTGGSTVTTTSTLHVDGTPTTGSNPVAISIKGNTSGVVGITTQAAAGMYNYNLPTTAGTAGQVQTSGGGGTSPMTWGNVGLIQASNNLTAQTAAGNITTFTVGASNATFNVSAYLEVTAVTTDVIQIQITYTDSNNTAQTISYSTINSIADSNYNPVTIRAKAATVITVKSNLTTGIGTITFNAGGVIMQM